MLRNCLFVLCLSIIAPVDTHAAAACAAPEFRQFDFWVGDWQVHRPNGELAGINRIRSEYDGCVIHERYATGKGYTGESLNMYDASRKVWHQTWVDSNGLLLTLEGRWSGKAMVLEGGSIETDGTQYRQRVSWTPDSDGSVRQLWEAADTKGAWSVVFDGRYTKK